MGKKRWCSPHTCDVLPPKKRYRIRLFQKCMLIAHSTSLLHLIYFCIIKKIHFIICFSRKKTSYRYIYCNKVDTTHNKQFLLQKYGKITGNNISVNMCVCRKLNLKFNNLCFEDGLVPSVHFIIGIMTFDTIHGMGHNL